MTNNIIKILSSIILVLLSAIESYAQDTITLKNLNKIACKVEIIKNNEIQYRRQNNLDGPLYIENRENILYIKYKNGEIDNFSDEEIKTEETSVEAAQPEEVVEDLYVVPSKVGILRYARSAPSCISLDHNYLSTERAYEIMGDRYDTFLKHKKKYKNWKKTWLIGIGVVTVVSPMMFVGAARKGGRGFELASIFVPVAGFTCIALGAGKHGQHKRKMKMQLGPIEY